MNTKKHWKIPVTWEMYGVVEIEAESLEQAIDIFDATYDEIPLPYIDTYVDGSFIREDLETIESLNSLS
jgi:hypothetical protein